MRASDRAYRKLLDEIVGGELPAGTVLGEVEQSERLGVSRTPLREAFNRLVADGMLDSESGRGVVVSQLSLETVTELYEVREGLEEQAARLAAQRADREVFKKLWDEFENSKALILGGEIGANIFYELNAKFDDAIDEAIQNPYMVATLKNVRNHMARVRKLARSNPARLLEAASETQLIVEAIATGDAALAAHATHVHLHKSHSRVSAAVREQLAKINKEVA
jgi:DNA-binding GntR family transcriptional regulator